MLFAGGRGNHNDVHYWPAYCFCWNWPNLHRFEVIECQSCSARFDEMNVTGNNKSLKTS